MKEFGVQMGMSARPQTKPRWWWGNDGEVIGVVEGFVDVVGGGGGLFVLFQITFYSIRSQNNHIMQIRGSR